jgi:hypothetical protein
VTAFVFGMAVGAGITITLGILALAYWLDGMWRR